MTRSNEQELLSNEIKKTGFLLEWNVAKICQDSNLTVEQNLLLHDKFIRVDSVPDRLIEIDIFAKEQRGDDGYVIECKGAASADKLVLITAPANVISMPSVYFDEKSVILDTKQNFLFNVSGSQQPVYCHTGDFFIWNGDKGFFTKSSRQDDKNNLFKGISQLYFGLDAICLNRSKSLFRVFPLIVTNAEIHVVNFNVSASLEEQITTRVVPWAAYQNPMTYPEDESKLGRQEWKTSGESDANIYVSQRRIPIIWIINVDHLQEFMKSSGKVYSSTFCKFSQQV